MEPVIIGNATLYRGDAMEIMPALGKVDAVVTDPPYFLPATHYSVRTGSAKSIGDLSILNYYFYDLFKACSNALKDDGVMYSFCDGQSYPVFYAVAYTHFKRSRPLVWDKVTALNGYHWRHQHELILFSEKQDTKPHPTGDGDVLRHRSEPINDRHHLAQKPVGLIEKLVAKCGKTVLDPFMGSGTTGIASLNLGKRFLGVEIESRYFDIACKRIEDSIRQGKLLA